MIVHSQKNNDTNNWDKVTNDNSLFTRYNNRRRIEFVPERSRPTLESNSSTISTNIATTQKKDVDKTKLHGNDISNNNNNRSIIGLFDEQLILKYIKWHKITRIGPGFYNDGNSCYLNSTLQCLIHTPPLAQILIQESQIVMRNIGPKNIINNDSNNRTINNHSQQQGGKPILQHFHSLVNEVLNANSSSKAISPRGKNIVSIRGHTYTLSS